MKKITRISSLVLLLSMVASLGLNAQNLTDKNGKKQGNWSKTYSNGQKQYEGTFKDDCEQGTFKYYNKDGSLKQTIDYKGDCKTGYAKIFYRKGQLMSEGSYVNQKKEGLWTYYSVDGKKLSEEMYKNGKKEGLETIWDTKGNVLETIMYKNGKKEGENYNFLYQDGYQTFTYKNDKRNGEYKNYYADKKIKIKGQFIQDKKDGEWLYYDQAGDVLRKQTWEANELISDQILIKTRQGDVKLLSKDIAYFYPLGKQTCIVMSDGTKYTCFNYFEQILDCIELDTFVRLNQKNNLYANVDAIKSVMNPNAEESQVILVPDTGIKMIADKEGLKVIRSVLSDRQKKK
ncbi:MAG: toxin-antitoxin system YwqK family antitoxin [Bacteroidales bacterium]|nr:toxin-antitoxin system YwqK family antitoxin [Bacteroidales bacterium]MEE0962376.1 toxin-antitoxin system YwqK family antitoxin [Bacteroidales bacterium]